MPLSAQAIRKAEFPTKWISFGAYDPEAVDAYLEDLASEVEENQLKLREVQSAVSRLSEDLERYRRIEDALQEALHVARENARRAEVQAAEKAQKTQAEAEFKAHQQISDAEQNASQIIGEAAAERDRLKSEIKGLEVRKEELILEMQKFLEHERMQLAMLIEGNRVDFPNLKGDMLPPLPHLVEANVEEAQMVAVNLEENQTVEEERSENLSSDESPVAGLLAPEESDELSELVNQLIQTDKAPVPTAPSVMTESPELKTETQVIPKKTAKRESAYKEEIDKIQQILSELQ